MDYIVGAEDYFAGRTDVLSGVRVLTNNTISITLDADFLPFFYEMGLLICNPYPISVIAPGGIPHASECRERSVYAQEL